MGISKWRRGEEDKIYILLSEFGPKVGILAGVGRVKPANFGNTAKPYRNWKSGLRGKIRSHYGDFLGKGPKMVNFKQKCRKITEFQQIQQNLSNF